MCAQGLNQKHNVYRMRYPSIICNRLTFFLLGLRIQNCRGLHGLFLHEAMQPSFASQLQVEGFGYNPFLPSIASHQSAFPCSQEWGAFFDAETRTATWTVVLRRAKPLATLFRRKKKPLSRKEDAMETTDCFVFSHILWQQFWSLFLCADRKPTTWH